uniref:Sec-independent protein secretion pathway component n=1 Tax=Desulfomonile tiedjei TaxID=2358 RepID=A0A7C4AR77_9BACT
MFGISMWELVLIVLVALILLGPRQLTETARVVGRLYRELLKLTSEVKETINLDALTEMPPKYEPPPPKTDLPRRPVEAQAIVTPPGEKTGPDFYAELLEQSAEPPPPEQPESAKKKAGKEEYKAKDKVAETAGAPEERGPIH